MRRRDLFALGTLALAGTAVATSASASEAPSGGGGAVTANIAGVGLPIISGGRIRNYVFVTISLTLGGSFTPEQMRAKEPYFRDALVRAAHRTPFVLANDWTQVDAPALCAAMMRIAPSIAGPGSIASVQVALQTPRRRTGVVAS
ncbi:hypothetical protein ACETK8_10360 [Brevundimonas staleyi]|uniref:Tat pathway signal protein n=1 Tax=Brevundimonas staleyi TaxID=74326 RepID=A0ABW0FPG5_9CAUL